MRAKVNKVSDSDSISVLETHRSVHPHVIEYRAGLAAEIFQIVVILLPHYTGVRRETSAPSG